MGTVITKISEINVGDFIKYSDRDKRGQINYIGEVIRVDSDKGIFEMLTFIGEVGFSLTKIKCDESHSPFSQQKTDKLIVDNQKLEKITTKPKGWAKYKKNPEKYLEDEKKANQVAPIKTKKQQVFDLVKDNPRKKLTGLLTMAKKTIGGNPATLKAQLQLALTRRK